MALGSPPRMRGKRRKLAGQEKAVGITPADAGKTGVCRLGKSARWDHPRGCGENHLAVAVGADALGSPPRMRGKPEQ